MKKRNNSEIVSVWTKTWTPSVILLCALIFVPLSLGQRYEKYVKRP